MGFKAKEFDELTTTELYEILKARAEIFVAEQKIIYVDMDDIDYRWRHFFLENDGKVIAYLSAFYEDESTVHIGRVLSLKHGTGLGKEVLEKAIDDIKRNMKCAGIRLNSQSYAVGFYEKSGFKTVSEEFLIENIPHYTMEFAL